MNNHNIPICTYLYIAVSLRPPRWSYCPFHHCQWGSRGTYHGTAKTHVLQELKVSSIYAKGLRTSGKVCYVRCRVWHDNVLIGATLLSILSVLNSASSTNYSLDVFERRAYLYIVFSVYSFQIGVTTYLMHYFFFLSLVQLIYFI